MKSFIWVIIVILLLFGGGFFLFNKTISSVKTEPVADQTTILDQKKLDKLNDFFQPTGITVIPNNPEYGRPNPFAAI